MSARPSLLPLLDTVITALQQLRLGLISSGAGERASSSESFEILEGPPTEPAASASTSAEVLFGPREPAAWTPEWESKLLASNTPADFQALDLRPLKHLLISSRLKTIRAASVEWDSLARLGAALRRGREARQALQNHTGADPVPFVPVRPTIFVCLHCPQHPGGFYTKNLSLYYSIVGDRSTRGPNRDPSTVVASFASFAEASAFLIGAEREWPQLLD